MFYCCRRIVDDAVVNLVNLDQVSVESKPPVKAELYRVLRQLMVQCGPMPVLHLVLEDIKHRNPRLREDVIIYVIFALLTFPR